MVKATRKMSVDEWCNFDIDGFSIKCNNDNLLVLKFLIFDQNVDNNIFSLHNMHCKYKFALQKNCMMYFISCIVEYSVLLYL